MSEGGFIQFPLALLALGENERDKRAMIIAYSTISAGYTEFENNPARANGRLSERCPDCAVNSDREDVNAWAIGLQITKLDQHMPEEVSEPEFWCDLYEKVKVRLAEFQNSSTQTFVRIPTGIFADVCRGEIPFRVFMCMCAVYSRIGRKAYCIIRRDDVRARAIGYSSSRDLFDGDSNLTPEGEAKLAARKDAEWLRSQFKGELCATTEHVKYDLERTCKRSLLFPAPVNRRTTAYSRNLGKQALSALIKSEVKTRRPITVGKIQTPPITVGKNGDTSPLSGPHGVAYGVGSGVASNGENSPHIFPTTVPTVIDTLNRCSVITSAGSTGVVDGSQSESVPAPKPIQSPWNNFTRSLQQAQRRMALELFMNWSERDAYTKATADRNEAEAQAIVERFKAAHPQFATTE
jgi:hypothetical protein